MRHNLTYRFSLACIALLLCCAGGFGWTNLHAQKPITLGEALAATLENNFDIRIEDKRSEISRNNNT